MPNSPASLLSSHKPTTQAPGSLQNEMQVQPMLCAVSKSFFAQVVPHQVSANPKLPLLGCFELMRLTFSLVWESTIQTFSEHESRDHLSTCHNAHPQVDVWNVRLSFSFTSQCQLHPSSCFLSYITALKYFKTITLSLSLIWTKSRKNRLTW